VPSSPHTGHLGHLVDGADTGLQAAATEVEAEDRLGTDPDPGTLAQEAQPGLLLAGQQGDRGAEHLLEAPEQLGAVGRVTQCRGGQGHHHIDPGIVGGRTEPAHGAHRRGGPVGRDAPGAGHLGPEVQEGAPAQHRGEHPVPGRVDDHQVKRATAQIEHGYTHGRHRRDAIPCGATPERPSHRDVPGTDPDRDGPVAYSGISGT
jgi:hypothetical protein